MAHSWTTADEDLGFEDVSTEEKQVETTTGQKAEEIEEEGVVIPENIDDEQTFVDIFGGTVEETETKEKAPETPKSIDAEYLKLKAKYKADKYGIEIDEDQEFDDETYQAFEDQLDDIRLEQKYNEFKDSSDFIKAVLDVAENEGEVADLLDLLGQRRELTEIDTSSLEGKVEKIKKYYKDVEGKSDVWINKQIRMLSSGEDTKELDDEFELISAEYDSYFEEEKTRQVEAAKQAKIQRENMLKRQVGEFERTLDEKKIPKKQAAELSDFVYNNTRYKLKNSNETISAFDAAILTARNKPEELTDLVLFLKDKKAYHEKIIVEAKNVVNEKIFNKKVQGDTAPTKIKPKFQFIK